MAISCNQLLVRIDVRDFVEGLLTQYQNYQLKETHFHLESELLPTLRLLSSVGDHGHQFLGVRKLGVFRLQLFQDYEVVFFLVVRVAKKARAGNALVKNRLRQSLVAFLMPILIEDKEIERCLAIFAVSLDLHSSLGDLELFLAVLAVEGDLLFAGAALLRLVGVQLSLFLVGSESFAEVVLLGFGEFLVLKFEFIQNFLVDFFADKLVQILAEFFLLISVGENVSHFGINEGIQILLGIGAGH